jgi:hypothetical protein
LSNKNKRDQVEEEIKTLTIYLKINITYLTQKEIFITSDIYTIDTIIKKIDKIVNKIQSDDTIDDIKIKYNNLIEFDNYKQLEIDYLHKTKILELKNQNLIEKTKHLEIPLLLEKERTKQLELQIELLKLSKK